METSVARRAVVTGAASGMGRACALGFRADGWDVLAVDVNEAGLGTAGEAGARVHVADLADPLAREGVVGAALEGPVDALVNAAGVILFRPIWGVTVAEFQRVMATNAEATWFLSAGIGPHIRPGGAIVNFSSPSAKLATTVEAAVYAASKTAILSITRSFAYLLAPSEVRVNAIAPGITDTPMQDAVNREVAAFRGMLPGALAAERLRTVPLGRSAPPDELAGVVRWLCGPESAYVTGQCLCVDGGMIMW
jgi:NAD(P)-dependent dehydrogenase (short-subunit alcohol dehydrogenase family)